MLQTTSQKIIAVVGTLALLAVIGYIVFNNSSAPATPADLSGQDVMGQDILTLADKVNTISIDQSVFSSPIFISLVDYQLPLVPELQGRPNPFASIGSDGGAVVVSGSKTVAKIPN